MTNLEQAIEELKAKSNSWKIESTEKEVNVFSKIYLNDGAEKKWHKIMTLRNGFLMTTVSLSIDLDYLGLIHKILKAQKEVK